jgi:hypothetical protein
MSEKEKTQRRLVVLANLPLGSGITNEQRVVLKSTKNFPRLDERALLTLETFRLPKSVGSSSCQLTLPQQLFEGY